MEPWDAEVCFLHIQFKGTDIRLSNKFKKSREVHFECSRSPVKSESWNNSNRQYCAVLHIWQNYRSSFVTWIYVRSLVNRLSHTWVHYVTTRVSLLTDHKISGRPIHVQIVSIPLIQVPLSWIDDHPRRNLKLCAITQLSYLSIHCIFPRISEHVLPCREIMQLFLREVFPS